jgi:hypothetical protein
VLVFAINLLIVVFNILPETHEARNRSVEVLYVRPIPERIHLAARALTLAAVTILMTAGFGLVSLSAGYWRFNAPSGRVLLLLGALVISALTAAIMWVAAIAVLVRWISIVRLRRGSQTLFLILIIIFTLHATGLMVTGDSVAWRFDIRAVPFIEALPSTWFARLALSSDSSLAPAQRVASLFLLVASLAIVFSGRFGRRYLRAVEMDWSRSVGTVSVPKTTYIPDALARLPLIGRWLLPPPVHGTTTAILIAIEREDFATLRLLVPKLIATIFFAIGLWRGSGEAVLPVIGYFVLVSTVEALDVVLRSAYSTASWMLFKAPLEARDVMRAIEWSVMQRAVAVPWLLFAGLTFLRLPSGLAAMLVMGTTLTAFCALAACVVFRPSWPLSLEQRTMPVVGFVLAFIFGISLLIVVGVVAAAIHVFGWLGLVLGVLALCALLAVAFALRLWAVSRLAGVECPH